MKARAHLLALVLVAQNVSGERLTGVVNQVTSDTATIILGSDLVPQPDDPVRIFIRVPGMEGDLTIGTGRVISARPGVATALMTKLDSYLQPDQLASIDSATPTKVVRATETPAAAGTPVPGQKTPAATQPALPVSSGSPAGQQLPIPLQMREETAPVIPAETVLFTDHFDRTNTQPPGPEMADNKSGGKRTVYYIPIFNKGTQFVEAHSSQGMLVNPGNDYGGIQFADSPHERGTDLGQDLIFQIHACFPRRQKELCSTGVYFRSRAAAAGDGIIGGESAGSWVYLVSNGQVKVKALNPHRLIAASDSIDSFDPVQPHQMQVWVCGECLVVFLDGKRVEFFYNEEPMRVVRLPASLGSNNGTAGIAFGPEYRRGEAGGQMVLDLIVARCPNPAKRR